MTRGREAALAALRPAFVAAGWRPRAAGWFTKNISRDATAVIATGAASRHKKPGTADVTLFVGLRVAAIEEVVERVCGDPQGPAYQSRTCVVPLGHSLPEESWGAGEREFGEQGAEDVAEEMVRLVVEHAEPWLHQLATDPLALAQVAEKSVAAMGHPGLCRIATLRTRAEGQQAGTEYVHQRIRSLADPADAAADAERRVAPTLLSVLNGG